MTFAAFRVPNFRLYCAGQAVSLVGTWMQGVAQSWLVLELTGSATLLGVVVAAQFVPVLVAAPYGGLVADRMDKRRLLLVTQATSAVLAGLLGWLTVAHVVRVWMVVGFALALGAVNAVDTPTRQSFVPELVGPRLLGNAVSLNSVMVSGARAVGPAVAGLLIAEVGAGMCFLLNAVSFVAVLLALAVMHPDRRYAASPVLRARGQLVAGFRYARRIPGIRTPLLMMAVVGTLAYEFQVVLPVLATSGLHGDATIFGYLTSAMGVGAVFGGLGVAARGRAGLIPLVIVAGCFAAGLGVATLAPSLPAELVALAIVGVASTAFLAIGNTTLQLICAPPFRGRVMALWTVAFLGSTPVGGPIIGVIVEHAGPRAGLAVGAVACLVAAVLGLLSMSRVSAGQRLLPRATPPLAGAPPTEAERI
jgi:MFS family permease